MKKVLVFAFLISNKPILFILRFILLSIVAYEHNFRSFVIIKPGD